jgi:hypothetical protein
MPAKRVTATRCIGLDDVLAQTKRNTCQSYAERVTGEPRPDDADLIVYIDQSDIREGRMEDLKDGIRQLVDVIRSREPQLIAYGFHLDEDAGRMTVTAVHPDSASLEVHLEIGREEFRKLSDMITLRRIEVYGSISEKVRQMLEHKAAMLGTASVNVRERFAGFAQVPGKDTGPIRR